MPIEKNVWDLVLIEPWLLHKNPSLWIKKVKDDRIAVDIIQRIIIEGIND